VLGSGEAPMMYPPAHFGAKFKELRLSMIEIPGGHTITTGDECAVRFQPSLNLEAAKDSELVLVDVGTRR
jgi:hypothetical protein